MEYDLEAYAGTLSKGEKEAKQEVVAQIKNTAQIYFNNYKEHILRELGVLARESRQKSNKYMQSLLSSLESFDMSVYKQDEFTYNFNLEVPEAEDIKEGMVEGAKALLDLGTLIPEVGPVIAGIKAGLESTNSLDKLAGSITHEKLVKPQRKKLIDDYFQGSLKPEFEAQLESIENSIIISIRKTLNNTAEEKINESNAAFETLRTEKETLKTEFTQRIDTLKKYKQVLEGK